MSSTYTTDVAIIGAGPVGLFAIFECGMLKLKCHVIDALDMPGGQCKALYAEKPIYDIPGFPQILAGDLIDQLMAQAELFEPVFHLSQNVTSLEKGTHKAWRLTTSTGAIIEAEAVIIAAGAGAFGPNRPPLEHLTAFEGKSIFYHITRKADFIGKRVMIAGGGDSAVDWAVELADTGAQVTVVHRRPHFRAAPATVDRLLSLAEAGTLDIVTPYQLYALEGDAEKGQLSAVIVQDLEGQTRSIETDVLLPFFGLAMNLGPIATWALNVENRHIPVDFATCETALPGVFAIGDIATYPKKLKLILSGFAEAAQAAHAIHPRVFPGQALHFEYSTTKGLHRV